MFIFPIVKKVLNPIIPFYKRWKHNRLAKQYGSLGNNVIVAKNSKLVTKNLYLDDFVIIQSHNNFISHKGRLFVKKYSVISSGCIIIPGSHQLKVGVPFWLATREHIGDAENDIHIGEDCWIGAGSILLPGVNIGRGCVIGAGSVVTKDIPDYAVAVGSPARIIATKFSFEDVVKHERSLYPVEERRSQEYLRNLYEHYFMDKSVIGDSELVQKDKETLVKYKSRYHIPDYSE